jgi:hypothetical protein
MTTDHQVTENSEPEPGTEPHLGMIITALIVIATLATVAVLVTR